MNSKRLFLDVHVIQTVPPSCINRDDTGSPKTAQYGGVRRARVSSQAWKSAMRKYFKENIEISNIGIRSLDIANYVKMYILQKNPNLPDEEALKLSIKVLDLAGIKLTKENKTKALFFLGSKQAEKLAEAALEGIEDKNLLKNILNSNPAIDIALFGRMLADDAEINEDASSQVAHAISTHSVQTEFDFFTAVDDLSPEDSAGAGMLGTVEYNASTLYRYSNVAVHEFINQLEDKEAAFDALKLFVEAFANSMPTGKVNTFANQTVPSLVLVSLRPDRPISLVSAFEKPIRSKDGYVKDSIDGLFKECSKVEKMLKPAIKAMYVSLESDSDYSKYAEGKANLESLKESLFTELIEYFKD